MDGLLVVEFVEEFELVVEPGATDEPVVVPVELLYPVPGIGTVMPDELVDKPELDDAPGAL